MMSKPIKGSVCLNHPNVAAVARCATCSKPICGECAQVHDGSTFCSKLCYDNAMRTGMMVDDVQRRKGMANFRRKIAIIINLLILAAIIYAGYHFYTRNKSKVDRKLQETKQAVQQKSSEAADTIRKSTVERESKYKRDRESALQ
ncbi:MAG TPA: B-box zinc finger protein [Lentisphaeria bacterium]|jgi:hypothetical protein|nr:hypothetical protein [Lentisphaerota bacterium]HPY89434.1 B-box zinc finger protein [Lentisphaeria bacterium]HQC52691.1 B-box zinc finger protein [Lentisphaeria bacterium]HQL86686.1 B-box zinc finger protein [Lentisphaeria bacterium]